MAARYCSVLIPILNFIIKMRGSGKVDRRKDECKKNAKHTRDRMELGVKNKESIIKVIYEVKFE